MKIFKRTTALVLTLVTILSMTPVQAFAEETKTTTEMNTGDMTIEGTNGFGNLLSQEIKESQEESSSAEENYAAGYSIVGLTFEGNTATVEYSSLEDAILVVALYSENGLQLLASGNVQVSSDEEIASVTIEGDMPEYFLASAYLVDTYDLSPLCEVYDTPMYTQEMQELLASTVNDYDPELVLNLDESEDTNFAVYAETTKIIEYAEGYNIVDSVDDETATYVIENADDQFTTLVVGDVVAYSYGNNEILIAKVGAITVDGSTVTITGVDLEMEEVFSHVKVESNSVSEDMSVIEGTGEEGITYVGLTDGADGVTPYAVEGGATVNLKHKFEISKVFTEDHYGGDEGGEVPNTITVAGTLEFGVEFEFDYYASWTRRYVKFVAETGVDVNIGITGKLNNRICKLPSFGGSPIIGVYIGIKPQFEIQASAELTWEASYSFGLGFSYSNDKGGENLTTPPKFESEIKLEGTLFFGIDLHPTIEVIGGTVVDVDLTGLVGFEINGKLAGSKIEHDEEDVVHSCELCIQGDIQFKAAGSVKITFLKCKDLTVDLDIFEAKFKICDYYASLTHGTFGLKTCPYTKYELTFEVRNGINLLMPDTEILKKDGTSLGKTNERGILIVWLPLGRTTVKATVFGEELQKTIKVTEDDAGSKVVLKFGVSVSAKDYLAGAEDCIDQTTYIASGKCGPNVYWTLSDDGILSMAGKGPTQNYDTGDSPWYSYRYNFSSVIIGKGVTSIGSSAFYGCENLTTVKIPSSVMAIGSSVFEDCTGLTSVEIPDSVTHIGSSVFENCTGLTSVVIGDSVTTIGHYAFDSCTSLASVTIPDSVTTIGSSAFYNCDSLTSVEIPDSVTTIGSSAFYDCDNLTSVEISDSVTTIGSWAFYGCNNLTTVKIPGSVTTIDACTFMHCNKLTSVEIPSGVTTIGSSAFYYCDNLTTVKIPSSVTTIGDSAFAHCTSIKSAKFPDSVTTIGDSAFYYCDNLTSVEIPDSVTTIGDSAFSGCDNLTSVTIGDSVATIGNGAFPGLTEIYVDEKNPYYSSDNRGVLFDKKKTQLIKVPKTISGSYEIPDGVTAIGDSTFSGCDNLTSVTIPDSVIAIGYRAFHECDNLTSVEIPNSVTTIGGGAFSYCDSLTSIEIPDSVTTIGGKAFVDSYDLKKIVFCGNAPFIESTIFGYITATAYYPAGNDTWTSDVMKAFGGYITWVPYTLDENGNMILNEAAAVTMETEETTELTDALVLENEEESAQTGLDLHAEDIEEPDETVAPYAVFDGEYSSVVTDTCTLKMASFSGLVPDQQYILLAMVSIDVENLLAADNLLYIDQAAALEDGTLVFQYVQRTATDTSYVVVCGASNKDLNDAEITFPEMITDGEVQTVNPTVVYDGKTLSEGQDYTILGTVSFTEPGTYTCYIRGVRNYAGLVECTYTVISPYYEVASGICGDNLTWTFYNNGRLTISGTGSMTEFSDYSSAPWDDRRSSIVTVIIDHGVTTISDFAFAECASLTSVVIGDSVTTIGHYAFDSCTSLASVTIPDSVTTIGSYVFRDCTNLTNAMIGDGVTSISTCAFQYCSNLTSVIIGDSVTTIKYGAFKSCTSLTSVTIPASVTTIGNEAFKSCINLTSVTIPASVTTIGNYAFGTCTNLIGIYVDENNSNYSSDERGILLDKEKGELIQAPGTLSGPYEIPASVTTIDDYAFSGCANLTSVTIPERVTTIGHYAFSGCIGLSQIAFMGDAPAIAGGAFSRVTATAYYLTNKPTWTEDVLQNYGGNITWVLDCIEHSYETIVTEPTCTEQGFITYTCSECGDSYVIDEVAALGHGYEAIVTEPTCTEQGHTTYTCSKCGDSYVTDEMEALGHSYEAGVTEQPTCTERGYTTYTCSKCGDRYVADETEALGHTYESDINEEGESTYTCITCGESYTEAISSTLQYVIAEDHVRVTGYTGSSTELAIPAEIEGLPVTVIGEKAFYDCDNLISITIPDSATTIGDMAFSDCYSLTSVTIPEGVTAIGDSAFSWCDSLTSVTIPEGVTTISDSTFSGCDNLVSVTLPEGITTIGDSAFYWCDSLTNVTIPDSVTTIGNDAFYLCNSLTSMTIPDSITTIGDYAFWSCTRLNDVTLSDSVTSIGTKAFGACTSLRQIKFMGDVPAIGEEVFYNVIATAYYPANNLTWTGDVFQNYGGEITWCIDIEELGDLLGLEIVSAPAGGFVGKSPDLSGLRVELICSDDLRFTADNAQLTISEIDTSTVGKKTVIVSYGGVSDEFTYLVHEGSGIVLDSSLYPESTHNYENEMDETQTLTWPGATGLVLVFSEETYVEGTYDRIYVYDGTDSLIASYSGSRAAGVTLEVPGDTVKIRLTSDYSTTYYGYSFTSISTADTVVHTGTDIIAAVEATCTEPGRTEGVVCEVCDQEQYTVIPALGHDYESVVTSPVSSVYSYITHTCVRCGDSYIDNVTVPGSIANGTCGDTLFWAVTETGILHIFGEGEMVNYEIAEAPWFRYEQQFQHAVIHKGVTTIGVYAFYNHIGLISVEIQDSVTTIGERAFYLCEGLTSVEIPDSVTTICDLAFYQCTSLTSLEIPNSVITIGNRPFQNCKNLESIYVDDDNLYFSSDSNGILFNKQQTTLIHAPQAISGDYTIPDGVIEIGSYAFAESNSLTSVEIPASVNTIGDLAFFLCSSLKGIYVDENNHNFSNDSYGVLFDKQQTVLVKAPTTISGVYAIPASVTAIGDYAFYNCRSLTSINIPSNVATIGNYAFYFCVSMESIDIRGGVTTIGDYAFGYTGLTSVEIPEGVTTIGQNAFTYCVSLESVSIPGSVTTFGDFAFQNCEALTRVEILDGVTKIGRYAFSHCVSLKSVSIPASVTIIDESAFSSCEALASVEISDGVAVIGRDTFARCFNLASVKIPASVISINDSAFSWCTSLREITFYGKAPTFGVTSFRNVTATVYYPAIDSTWTVEVMQNYGGTLTWEAYTPECTDHAYEAVVTEPTCIEQGYTTYTCSVCGHSYVDDYVDALGHNYVDGACTRCGEKDPNATVIAITSQPTDYVGLVGDTATFTVVAEGKELKYQWYFYDIAASEWKKSPGNTFATISVEFKAYRNNQEYRCEITDANENTVTTDIVKLVAKEVDLSILSHPVDYVGSVNDNVSMEVEASGNGLTYQWYFSDDGGVTWAKSGSPGFATANLQPILRAYRDGYKFYCLVTDIFGNTVQSDVASMTVKTSDVVITRKPVDVNGAKLGELYYFEAEATGDNLEYSWEFSSDNGATWQLSWNQGYNTATLGVRMNANRDGYLYRCKIVSGLKTVVYTDPVSLNLQEPSAQIVTQPTNVVTIVNKTIKFQVEAIGTDLTYKWYRSNDKGATWIETFLSGYNTDTLSFVATNARAAMYMCKVTDGSGRVVWSSPVKLQILSAELKILNQPESITCASGATATFTVKAQGDGLKYQWYASSDGGVTWTISYLGGYNTDTFSFIVNTARAAKLYKCVITDAGGNTVETNSVSVTIG